MDAKKLTHYGRFDSIYTYCRADKLAVKTTAALQRVNCLTCINELLETLNEMKDDLPHPKEAWVCLSCKKPRVVKIAAEHYHLTGYYYYSCVNCGHQYDDAGENEAGQYLRLLELHDWYCDLECSGTCRLEDGN